MTARSEQSVVSHISRKTSEMSGTQPSSGNQGFWSRCDSDSPTAVTRKKRRVPQVSLLRPGIRATDFGGKLRELDQKAACKNLAQPEGLGYQSTKQCHPEQIS